jgi:hypothetical protein
VTRGGYGEISPNRLRRKPATDIGASMSIADTAHATTRPAWLALDKLGVLIALIAAAGAILPFALFRANRIVVGKPKSLLEALPSLPSGLLIGILLVGVVIALLRFPVTAKLAAGFAVLAALMVLIGQSASYLTPEGDTFARVSPGAGFWLLLFAFALLVTDALTRLRFKPLIRIAILVAVIAASYGAVAGTASPSSRNTPPAPPPSGPRAAPTSRWPSAPSPSPPSSASRSASCATASNPCGPACSTSSISSRPSPPSRCLAC